MYKTDTVSTLPNSWDTEARQEFYVAIAYDGFSAGNSALKLYEHLQEQFGRDLDIRRTVRSFASLGTGDASSQQDEKKPDMIIVASHRSGSLPIELQNWLAEELAESSDCPQALVALVNIGNTEEPTAIYQQLARAANRAGATFFHHQPGGDSEDERIDLPEHRLEKGGGLND
jgi:hypothetical protein